MPNVAILSTCMTSAHPWLQCALLHQRACTLNQHTTSVPQPKPAYYSPNQHATAKPAYYSPNQQLLHQRTNNLAYCPRSSMTAKCRTLKECPFPCGCYLSAVGSASVSCEGGCTCVPTKLLGHTTERTSQLHLHNFYASQADACVIAITGRGGYRTLGFQPGVQGSRVPAWGIGL